MKKPITRVSEDLRHEYTKATPNRFAGRMADRIVVVSGNKLSI